MDLDRIPSSREDSVVIGSPTASSLSFFDPPATKSAKIDSPGQPDSDLYALEKSSRSAVSLDDGTRITNGLPANYPAFSTGHDGQILGRLSPSPVTNGSFECDKCSQELDREHDVKRYTPIRRAQRNHRGQKPFPCLDCSESFSRRDALKRHMLAKGHGKGLKPLERPGNGSTNEREHSLQTSVATCVKTGIDGERNSASRKICVPESNLQKLQQHSDVFEIECSTTGEAQQKITNAEKKEIRLHDWTSPSPRFGQEEAILQSSTALNELTLSERPPDGTSTQHDVSLRNEIGSKNEDPNDEVQPPPLYLPPEIPNDIFEPILRIAQLGYDADALFTYYLTTLRYLHRIDGKNTGAAHTLVAPISLNDEGPPPPPYSETEIPFTIVRPLFRIAQLGYDGHTIRTYYLTVLRLLQRINAETAEAPHTRSTPILNHQLPDQAQRKSRMQGELQKSIYDAKRIDNEMSDSHREHVFDMTSLPRRNSKKHSLPANSKDDTSMLSQSLSSQRDDSQLFWISQAMGIFNFIVLASVYIVTLLAYHYALYAAAIGFCIALTPVILEKYQSIQHIWRKGCTDVSSTVKFDQDCLSDSCQIVRVSLREHWSRIRRRVSIFPAFNFHWLEIRAMQPGARKIIPTSVLKLMRSRPKPGHRRLEWTCSCGCPMYGDYRGSGLERFGQELRNINRTNQLRAGDSTSLGSSYAPNTAAHNGSHITPVVENSSQPEARSEGSRTSGSTDSSVQSTPPLSPGDGSPTLSTVSSSTSISLPSAEMPPTRSFLELCVNRSKYLTRVGEISIVDKQGEFLVFSDFELFAKIKSRYNDLGRSGVLGYLYRPRDIRFVYFGIRRGINQAGIYNKEPDEIPPESEVKEQRYHYYECPLPQMPPMDKRTFFHYFWDHASHAPTNDMTFHDRLPKKLGCSILMASSSSPLTMGWGVHIIEGPNWPVFPWIVVVLLTATLVMCVVYDAVFKGRESGFTIGQLVFSILMAILSSVISYVVDTV